LRREGQKGEVVDDGGASAVAGGGGRLVLKGHGGTDLQVGKKPELSHSWGGRERCKLQKKKESGD